MNARLLGGTLYTRTLTEASTHDSPILDSLADGVSVCDEGGYLLYTNPAEDRLFGYDRGELIGQHLSVRTRYPPEENRRILAEVLKEVERNGSWVGELSSRRKDGSAFTSHARFSVLALGGRNLPLCLQEDVTEARRICSRRFSASASFSSGGWIPATPNGATWSRSAWLPTARQPSWPNCSHSPAATSSSRNTSTWNTVVRQAEAVIHFATGEGIEVRLRLSPDVGPIFADPRRVEQVLMNLVLNARDAMPTGGRLTIETTSARLDEEYRARYGVRIIPGRYTGLMVSDSGHGMEPGTLARMWEPFFTTKPVGRGTGLGLAMVYGSVKQGGGFVWAESEPGQGTVIRVHWPEMKAARTT